MPQRGTTLNLRRERLAVIFGIKRFHKCIYGHKFTILTDNKPLLSLFSEMRTVSQMQTHEYTIVYEEGTYQNNADAPSRLPLPEDLTWRGQKKGFSCWRAMTSN